MFQKNGLRVRIDNDTRYPMGTKVILFTADYQEIDLTELGLAHYPVGMEITDEGIFAVIRFPVDSINIYDGEESITQQSKFEDKN
jgi:hypothetical protein